MSNQHYIREQAERRSLIVETETDGRGEDRGMGSEQLIPGIPNEITVNHIIPKLLTLLSPIVYTLSLVSTGWRKAIQSDEVFHARARSSSTETLVLLSHNPNQYVNRMIALYSMTDKSCYQLPPIPGFGCRFPWLCKCISMDQKIYVIGGEGDRWGYGCWEDSSQLDRGVKVYVLDLARVSFKWKRCADMQEPRRGFGCGVKDGKIYVFGGTSPDGRFLCESEVYDPKTNSWFSIPPMKTEQCGHYVATVGEELVVYGGGRYNINRGFPGEPYDLEFYHPGRNEWSVVAPFGGQKFYHLFMKKQKFYVMTSLGIDVNDEDVESNSWTELHSFSLPAIEPRYEYLAYGCDNLFPVLAVNGELVTIAHWHNSVTDELEFCLVQSKGFGSTKKELLWEKAIYIQPIDKDWMTRQYVLCPVIL